MPSYILKGYDDINSVRKINQPYFQSKHCIVFYSNIVK